MVFTWPDAAPGEPDNVVAAGQRISVRGAGTALGFLAVGTSEAGASATGQITYSDGTTKPYPLGVPDVWTGKRSAVVSLPYRNGPSPSTTATLFAQEVPLEPGKKIRTVTLAVDANLHVFAVALRRSAGRWVGTWATAQHESYDYSNATEWCVRMPVHVSVGGKAVRIRLSNALATKPLRIVDRARAHNLRIIGGTILHPIGRGLDSCIDFGAAVRDPADPHRLRHAFDSGDHLHPNEAGFEAMADAVDLDALN